MKAAASRREPVPDSDCTTATRSCARGARQLHIQLVRQAQQPSARAPP